MTNNENIGTNLEKINIDHFSLGFILGILIGEGHFGGDGKQPQITLRMHTRHETLFRWLVEKVPGSKLYGPYHHGGRSYYQWMARGEALKQHLLPLLKDLPLSSMDGHATQRLNDMLSKYKI